MDPVRAPGLPVQNGIAGNSACLQIDVLSGAQRNPQSDLGSAAIFFGSDPECDFILSEDYFPPMYAFLLVDSKGAVVRYLGGGPPLLLDHKPITRHRITKTANITGGPLALKLHLSSGTFPVGHSPSADGQWHVPTTEFDPMGDEELRLEKNIQLIEQASRLLASISDRRTVESTPVAVTQVRNRSDSYHRSPAALSLSVGRPATGQLPPLWHHICVN